MAESTPARRDGVPDDRGDFPDRETTDELVSRLVRESDAILAAIVQSSDDAIVSKTLDGIVRTWNEGARRIFGYEPHEMVGQPIEKLLPSERRGEEQDILRRLRRGERIEHFETVRVRKDGRRVDVSVTISPIRDKSGQIIGASKIARDITQQKHYEHELRLAKEQAESTNRAKDRFLASLSHELRTPLTPVLAAVTFLVSRHDLPQALREDIEMIQRNVEIEARLIDDLLDLTRIARNKIQLHFEALDIDTLLNAAVQTCRIDLDAKDIQLTLSLSARQHHVWGDSARLQQVLLNLLNNAIKFTPRHGRIHLATTDIEQRVRIEISDTGVGIDPNDLHRIFDAFEQGEPSVTRQFGGLGLGLAISRSLVTMHKGTISAASRGPGQGATFAIDLTTVNVAAPTNPRPEAAEPSEGSGNRILLVEDHPDTLRVLSRLLKSLGYHVRAVGSVKAALEAAENEPFELLISDIGLPDGSGTEIARELRARRPIRAIALSGLGLEEDIRRSTDAGFARHLIKPVNVQVLRDAIQQVMAADDTLPC